MKSKIIIFIFVMLLCVGCRSKTILPIPDPLPLRTVIEKYNDNVNAVEPFTVAISRWKVKFIDENGKEQSYSDTFGKMFYCPPTDQDSLAKLHLMCSTILEKEAFAVASNQHQYWTYSKIAKAGQWGKYIHQSKPCSENMPINPQILLNFIALRPIPDDPQHTAYKIYPEKNIIEYIAMPGSSFYLREIKIDRRDSLPKEINAYDHTGLRVIHCRLDNYKKIKKAEKNAQLPSYIYLEFPTMESYLELKLGTFNAKKPDERLFIRPTKGIENFQQIDKECENDTVKGLN